MRPLSFAALAALLALPAFAQDTPAPEGAALAILAPADGATVSSPVTVIFGLSGMGVAPAGVERDNTGHHHLLINATLEGEALREPIPADENHVHFGGGQTQATIDLPPGEHRLQLVLGDWAHVPHTPPVMSEPVSITVK